ncbi:MAG: cobalamin biosynthesis protein CbiX [Verrucomicrobia bacterium]|nr:cobalamin biosynthesis protein CbiX [Verrucomicrobiota bacterium]
MNDDLSDAALVLVGHGSTVNADSSAPVYQQAAALRAGRRFAHVHQAFWKQAPFVTEVTRTVDAPRVFIVPFFISDGYFSDEVIPRELGFGPRERPDAPRLQRRGRQTLYYCRAVGSHPSMTRVILARAADVVAKYPFPRPPKPAETALFIAGHGTDRNENSRQAVESQVEWIRSQKFYTAVHGVYLEEAPRIGDCYRMTTARNLVVVPFFISDGVHTQRDIPVLLGAPRRVIEARATGGQPPWRNPTEQQGKWLWYASSVGSEPCLAEVIVERVFEAAEPR